MKMTMTLVMFALVGCQPALPPAICGSANMSINEHCTGSIGDAGIELLNIHIDNGNVAVFTAVEKDLSQFLDNIGCTPSGQGSWNCGTSPLCN